MNSTPAFPIAITILPQFGSSPAKAVLTNFELATEKPIFFASCSVLEFLTFIVTNLDGPLKHLKNEWHFKEINNNTQLEFFIDFELKNPILNGIMKKSFELGLNKIAKAFEERAVKLYK